MKSLFVLDLYYLQFVLLLRRSCLFGFKHPAHLHEPDSGNSLRPLSDLSRSKT